MRLIYESCNFPESDLSDFRGTFYIFSNLRGGDCVILARPVENRTLLNFNNFMHYGL